jgi:NlpC/P60 family putative phage cell wall peptidase
MSENDHRKKIVSLARDWIATPYRHQGSIKGVGCDCLGLVRGVWRELYGQEPQAIVPYSMDWAESGANDALLNAAQSLFLGTDRLLTGSLIVFRWRPDVLAKHLGIYVGNDHFIHAYERGSVVESPLVPQWRKRITGIFDFPKSEDNF